MNEHPALETSDDVIINFAPTGMVPTKGQTPHVPLIASEIIEEVHAAVECGISMLHLHARDETTGLPTYRAEVYARLIEGIRTIAPELVICVSLSGRKHAEFSQRSEVLKLEGALKPDMGSLTLGSINFSRHSSINAPDMIRRLAVEMAERKILPELEVFDLGMINYANYLIEHGILKPPHYFNLLFGSISGMQPELSHAAAALQALPEAALWSMGGLGKAQLKMNAIGVAEGGGARVGLEDNLWMDSDRKVLATNRDLLQRVKALAEANGRTVMSSSALRKQLGLNPGNGKYGLREDPTGVWKGEVR